MCVAFVLYKEQWHTAFLLSYLGALRYSATTRCSIIGASMAATVRSTVLPEYL